MGKIIDRETFNLFLESENSQKLEKKEYDREIDGAAAENVIKKFLESEKNLAVKFGKFFLLYREDTGVALDANNIDVIKAISKKIKEIAENDAIAKEFDDQIKAMERKKNDQKLRGEEEGWTAEKQMPDWPTYIERSFPKENE